MKTLILSFPGQLKSGKNGMQTTRTGRHYPKPEWAAWRDGMVCLCLGKNRAKVAFSEPARVNVDYWPSDRRRRDVAGMIDAICHVLERAGIVTDDSLLVDWDWHTLTIDRESPKAIITIMHKEQSC